MSDIPDFTRPSTPEAPAPEPQVSQKHRPSRVIQRDLAVARFLARDENVLYAVMEELELSWRLIYNAVCRLRTQGIVELHRNGTRKPTWRVTERGHEWLGTTSPTEEPAPPPAPQPTAPPAAEVPVPVPGPEPAAAFPSWPA